LQKVRKNIASDLQEEVKNMSDIIQEAIDRLHARGGRITNQRRLILETLEDMSGSGHPTAEELHSIVKQQDENIHLSTVYRTLRWLQNEGIVASRMFDEETRQERFDPALPTEHHHFVCSKCNQVIEFNDPLIENIKTNFAAQSGSQVESAAIVLYGICKRCQLAPFSGSTPS
jgi:Fe2+ or Zn2+ uptake regulation protein